MCETGGVSQGPEVYDAGSSEVSDCRCAADLPIRAFPIVSFTTLPKGRLGQPFYGWLSDARDFS